MPTGFTITGIDYGNTPSGTQTKTFEYKLHSASTWTLISNAAVVNTNGTLVTPLAVTGLTAGQVYHIRSFNNCDTPPKYYTQQIQL